MQKFRWHKAGPYIVIGTELPKEQQRKRAKRHWNWQKYNCADVRNRSDATSRACYRATNHEHCDSQQQKKQNVKKDRPRMGGYQVHGLSKREPRRAALPVHDWDHQLRGQRPDESKADRDKHKQRKANPKCDTRLCLIPPRDKRHNEQKTCNHDNRDEREHHEQ